MKKTFLSGVATGSIIAKDVYGTDGVLLIKKGSTFREHFIKRFREGGVQEIYVEDTGEMTKDTVFNVQKTLNLQDVIHDKTRVHAQNQIKKTMLKFSGVSSVNVQKISKMVEEMIEQLLEKKDFVFALTQLRSVDDYTYQHSVNVGVLSLIIGIDLGLDKEALKALGIGAILHDIGKVMISEDIIKKPSKLTHDEFDEIKKHTTYGYEILKQTDLSEISAQIALYHHEKYDGSGYCRGLKSEKIPLYSRIVAVADVYDAMSNDRVYQKRSPHDVVFREITHLGNKHFDTEIMEKFAKHLNIYPTGTGVVLNTGHRGIVLEQNRLYPESPFVRMFTPENKDYKNLYFDLDLSLTKNHYIVGTF